MTSFSASPAGSPGSSPRDHGCPNGRAVATVWAGGSIGCALRAAADLAWPVGAGGFPITVLLVNLIGAFALGLLLERLPVRGSDSGVGRRLRLLLGTGLLGGFTTYSAFAVGTVELVRGGAALSAMAYAAITVLIGCVMARLGILLARVTPGRSA